MDKFASYKQLLRHGVLYDQCVFCYDNPDSFIVRGATKEHTFNLPFKYDLIDYLIITYTQENHKILTKEFSKEKSEIEFKVAEFDRSLVYYTLSEDETLKFKADIPVYVQLKAAFSDDHRIITSEIYEVEVIDQLNTDTIFNKDASQYALEIRIQNQDVEVNQFFDTVTLSNGLYKCKFYFDSTWDKFYKTAYFEDEYRHYVEVDIIETMDNHFECAIPDIVLEKPGHIHVGVAGVYSDDNEDVAKPTVCSSGIRIPKGCLKVGNNLSSSRRRSSFVYYGIVDDAYSTSIDDLSILTITKNELLNNGFKWRNYTLNNQYQVIAIPKNMGIECEKIIQEKFTIYPTTHEDTNYIYYYFSSRATGTFTSTYYFKEVS